MSAEHRKKARPSAEREARDWQRKPRSSDHALLLWLLLGGGALVALVVLASLALFLFALLSSPDQTPPPPTTALAPAPPVPEAPAPVVRAPVEEAEVIEEAGAPADPPRLPPGERPRLVLDAGGHTSTVMATMLTPDARQVITVSFDHTVRIWDVKTGETVTAFRAPKGAGNEGTIRRALSSDGKRLAFAGRPFGRGAKAEVRIYVLDLQTQRLQRVLKGHRDIIASLDFSRDGQRLASGSTDRTARIYDLNTGATLKVLEGHTNRVYRVAFSPDGQRLATGSNDNTARIWSVATGQTEALLAKHRAPLGCLAWSPDGQTLATGANDGLIQLWGRDGTPGKSFSKTKPAVLVVTALAFTPDGRELLYAGGSNRAEAGMLDLARGRPRVEFTGHSNTVMDGRLSTDGKLAVSTGGNNHETCVWRTDNGALVQKLQGAGRMVCALAWSKTGNTIAWGNDPSKVLAPQPYEQRFHLDRLVIEAGAPGQWHRGLDHRTPYSLRRLGPTRLGIARDGKERIYQTPRVDERIACFTTLPGDRLVVGGVIGLYLVDLATGKTIREFHGYSGHTRAVGASPDGRYFVGGGPDQTICVFSPQRSLPLLSLFLAGPDWIAWSPEGYYAASPGGERLMGWQINRGLDELGLYYPAVQFRRSLYQPDVVRRLVSAGSLGAALAAVGRERGQALVATDVGRVLPPDVNIALPQESHFKGGPLKVTATARSRADQPVTALRLLVDGRPYKGQRGVRFVAKPRAGLVRASWTVELMPGKHRLVVQAASAVSHGTSPTVEVVHTGPRDDRPPNLYILAVGVAAYPGPLRLQYAGRDAEAIVRVFKDRGGKAFHKVEARVLTDRQATRANVLAGLAWLEEVMMPRDVAILFFSGHGARDEKGMFYLVPVDVKTTALADTCISGEFLKKSLANMPGRLIAMLDACHSGAAADQPLTGSLTDDLARDLLTDDYGVVVMSSSLGHQVSLESPEHEAGFFTLGLVEGLSGKADLNGDRIIHLHELDAYATLRVSQLTRGQQTPVTGRPPTIRSFPLSIPP